MTRELIIAVAFVLMITGCSGPKRQAGGGYYKDDGPDRTIPANIQAIPNAVPRIETHAPANRRPYVVFGKRYVPLSDEQTFRQTGVASWYGRKFHGNKTANGETYDMYAMTAAHPTLPLPSYARVTRAKSGKSVIVRINDRGPFHSSRIIDLSYVAAAKLDLIQPGSGQVIVEAITNDDIRSNAYQHPDQPTPQAMPIPDARPPAAAPTLTVRASSSSIQTQSNPRRSSAAQDHDESAPKPDALDALYLSTGKPGLQQRSTADTNSATLIFLQYGAFSAHENASGLMTDLNRKIGAVEHRRAEIKSADSIHRVRIGPYSTRTEAVNAALRIQSETGKEASYIMQSSGDSATQDRSRLSL